MPEIPNTEFENKLVNSDFGRMVPLPGANALPKAPADMSVDELASSLKGEASLFLGKALPNPYTPQKISPLQIDQTGRYNKQLVGWDNEDIYGSMQSNWDKAANGVLKGLTLAGTTFLQGTAGLVYGLGNVITGHGANSFYNNDFSNWIEGLNKSAENALPNYYQAKETNAEWYSPDNLFTANFIFDKLIKNVGFSLGALASGGVVSKGISLAMRGVGMLSEAAQAARVVTALEEVLPATPQAARLSKFQEILTNSLPKFSAQKIDRVATSFFGAATEGGIEALQGLNEFRDAKIREFQQGHGRTPNDQEMAKINDAASSLGNARFFMNIGLLSATNYIQLPKILGSRYATSKGIANTEAAATRRLVTGETVEGIERALPTTKLGRIRSAVGHAGGLFLSASEGFEEGAQYIIQEGVNDYYSKKYGGEGATFLGSLYEGASQLSSKEGMESIILGSLSGGLQQSGFATLGKTGKLAERGFFGAGGKRGADTAVQVAEINGASLKWFSDMQDAASRGVNLMKEQEAYIRQGDVLETKDKEQDLMHNYLAVRIKNGRYDLVKEDIASLRQAASTQQGLDKLVTEGFASPDDTIATFQARLSNFEKHADLLKPTYEALNLKYGGLYTVLPDGTKKRIYTDEVIDKMAYAVSKIADYDTRIPQLSQELLSNGIDIQTAIEGKALETSTSPSTEAFKQIDALNINVDQKDALKTALSDIMEMTSRRQKFLKEYDEMAKAPATYEEKKQEAPTGTNVIITTKEGEQEFQIGEEYYAGAKQIETNEGGTRKKFAKFTIIGESEDKKSLIIKDSKTGATQEISKDKLADYKITKTSDASPNAQTYIENTGNIFTYNLGKKEANPKGTLEYEDKNLYFVSLDGKFKRRITRDELLPGINSKTGEKYDVAKIYTSAKFTEKAQKAISEPVTKEEIADKYANRQALVSELIRKSSERIEQIKKDIAQKQRQISSNEENISSLLNTKGGTPRKRVAKAALKTIEQIGNTKALLLNEIAALKEEQTDLENSLPYYQDLLENLGELSEDITQVTKDLKEDIASLEEIIDNVADAIKTGDSLIEKIDTILKQAYSLLNDYIKRLREESPAQAISLQEYQDRLEPFLGEVGAQQFIDNKEGFTLAIKGLQAEISEFGDELGISNQEEKLKALQINLKELNSSLDQLIKEQIAKAKILEYFEGKIKQFKEKEALEQAVLKDIELQKQFFNKQKKIQLDSGIATPSPEEQQTEEASSIEKRESARKPTAYLFSSTTTPSVLKRASDIVHQRFLSRLDFFPNRNNIKRTYVTENNEEALGLEGIIEKHLGEEDYDKYHRDAILAIYVETSPEGQFFVNEKGERVGKIGENAPKINPREEEIDQILYDSVPEDLEVPDVISFRVQLYDGIAPELEFYLTGKPEQSNNLQTIKSFIKNGSKGYNIFEPFLKGLSKAQKNLETLYSKYKEELANIPKGGGESINLDKLVYAAMPTSSLEDSYGKRYAGEDEEEAKAWQKAWEQKRQELLSYTKEYLAPEEFFVSRGIPEKSNNKEYIIGTLVSEQQLKNNVPVIVISTTGQIEHQGKKINIPAGRVMIQNGSFLEYANNRNLTEKEAQASFNVLKEFVRKANEEKTFDPKLLKFLQGILYFQSPYITEEEKQTKTPVARNQFYFHQGSLFFGEKEFPIPFTSVSLEANKDVVMAFLKGSYNHINNKLLTDSILSSQPFIEYINNLEEKEWPNYQTYLLSKEGRSPEEVPLSTSIRPINPLIEGDRNFKNKYSYNSTLLKVEDVNYQKPEQEEEVLLEKTEEQDISGMTEWDKFMAYAKKESATPKEEKAAPSGFKITDFTNEGPEEGQQKGGGKNVLLSDIFGAEQGTDEFQKLLDEQAGKNTSDDESQFRIAIPSYNYTLAKVEEEKAYIEKNSPFSVQTVKNLVSSANGIALWGAYKNAIILLDEAMEEGTGYHELFEGIFDVFLNNAEKKRIYKEFISRKGAFIDRPTGILTEYSLATTQQAKEQMAEEFRDFKLYGEMPSEIESATSPIIKFFQDLLKWIKSIFTGEINSLDTLFSRMDSAYYKNAAFKNAPTQILQAREKIGDFDAIETDTVVRAVVSSVFQNLFQEGNTKLINDLDFREKVPVEIYNKIKEQLQYYYLSRKDQEGKILPNTAYKELKEQGLSDANINNVLKPIALSLFKNWDQVVRYSGELLKTFKILQEADVVDKEGEETEIEGRDSYWKEAFEWDGKKNAPASVKLLIATLQESAFVATSGTIVPGEAPSMKKVTVIRDPSTRMQKMVDYAKTFNSLLDQLANINTLEGKEVKIRELADLHPEYVRLFTRLRAASEKPSLQDWFLRIKFYNTFAKQHPLALNTYLRPDGTSSIGAADLDSSLKQLSNNWLSMLKASPAAIYKEGKYFLNTEYKEKGKPLFYPGIATPSDRLKYLASIGIKFSPQQVNNLTKEQEKALSTAISSLRTQLKGTKVDISSLYSLRANTPLEAIFKIFLQTQNLVPNSVFADLSGNYRQSFVQTNAISRMANDLNNSSTKQELFQELPNLQDEYSSDSYYLSSLYNEEGQRQGHEFRIKYIQGIVAPDGQRNTPTEKLSRSKKLLQAINQNLNENYYLLIPADGKTEWMMGMKNPFLSLSDAALSQFYKYYQNEQGLGGSSDRIFSFLKDHLSEEEFNKQLSQFVEDEVAKQFKELKDYNIITNVPGGKFNWEGLDASYIEANKLNHKKLSAEDVHNILVYRTVNFAFNNIEMHKLFFGDPAKYTDFKRYKSFLSPREQALYNSPKFDAKANEEYNQVNGQELKKGDPGYQRYRDALKTVTQEDVISLNELPEYSAINGTDAQGLTHPAAYKQMRIKTARWNSLDEEQIQFIHAEDRLLMEEDGLYKYSSQILKRHDQKLLANKDPHTSRFSPLKPIVAGHEAEGPILDKYSIAMLSYRMVRGTNLARQYKRMLDNEIDYTIYKSGRKVGARGLDSIYNADGSPNIAPYNKEAIINIPFKWWGIQVETQGDKFSQTWGSQLGKLATMNLLDAGEPIGDTPERKEEIGSLISHERSIREAMIEAGYQSLLHKIGINKDGTISKKKLLKTIKDELTRRELNDNIKDALKLTDDGEFYIPLEALNNYEQIKNIIFSYIDKNISRPKVGGGSKIQVSSSGIEAAGHRIIAHTKKGKTTYTSAGLKFYTKEEPWMEIMVGNWFADKIRRIPALNGLSDEEILKRINESPDGKEILSGIGFRIPTQELNSVENFRIKAFLPDYLGDMVAVPEALTKKSGGDFDVDKLNTYLKNVYVNGKGQLAIIPFQGIGEDGLEAFRELVAKETFQKLISITPLDKFKAKTQPEEGEEETEEGIQANIEALNTGELMPDALEDAKDAEDLAQKMYRQSLENEYYKTVGELLSLPENFDHLVSPNNSDELMALRDRLSSLVPEEFGQGLNKTVLSPTFMNTLRHMYAEGKGGVGIAASAQVQNALAQKTPIVINPQKISQLKDKNEKSYIGNASILLPHNSVQAGGKTFSTISKIKDQAGRYISTKISQFINGFVDIANDPFLVQIGVNNNNAGTFLLLERLGVPTEVTILFMNQPIIREYQKSLDKIGMSYPYIKDNVDAILSNSKFKADKNKVPKQFPSLKTKELSVYLEDNIDKFYNGELTKEQREFQHFVLGEYLKYSVIASNLFRLSQATNYDTARFTNPYLYLRKLVKTKDARTNNIFSSPDAILSSTFVGLLGDKVGEATKKIADAFFQFLHSDIQPYVFPIIYKLAERKKMNDQEFIKAVRKVEQSFISYLIQNTTGLNARIKELLVDEETSLAKSLQQMKAKIESLPNNPFPIISRFIAENMSSPEATKSIRMFDKGTDVFSQNTLIAAMQELKANPATSELYGKLARVAFLQSGIAQTPTSFIDIIPVEDFKAFVLPAIKNLYNTDLLRGFQQTNTFYKNSWRDPNIIPRLPLKFSDREEDMIFDPNFGDFVRDLNTPTNRYKNTSLEQYAKQKGINNFVAFKVSERSNQYSSDYISVQMGDKNKKTFLLQKLIDPVTGEPFTQPYPNEEKYGRYAIYYQINPLGDGYKAQEHYRDNRRSVLETEAASIPVELSPTEILSAIRGNKIEVSKKTPPSFEDFKNNLDQKCD